MSQEFGLKNDGRDFIRHYVVAQRPTEAVFRDSGTCDQVEYYRGKLRLIKNWSRLTLNEMEDAIKASPDMIRDTTHTPNFKPLFLEALKRMRIEEE